MTNVLRIVVLPVLAVLLVVGAWLAPTDDAAPRPPGQVDVTQAAYACPAGSSITVAAGQLEPGDSSTATALPDATDVEALQDAAAWRTATVDGTGALVQQTGTGSGAVGFFAGTAPSAGGGGLVVGSCPGIVDDAWLLGLGSGSGHFSTLILTNLADDVAVVDLELWGADGVVDAVDAEGIVIEPGTTQRIRLDELAAREPELAVHVRRERGSLSAVVNDSSTGESAGTEPISSASEPRRDQVVSGLVPGEDGRTLLLLNPGDATARVDVEVIGPDNTFTPSGLESIQVPAGTLQSVTVPESAGADAQALSVTSDQPVSATVRMAPTDDDYAYAESGPVLAGPAVVPVDLGEAGGDLPDLQLSAPGDAASVEVEAFDASMTSLTSATVEVAGGTTSLFEAADELDADDVAYLVVRPRGDVTATATYRDGEQISSLALAAAPVTVLGPQVRPIG